MQVKSRADFYDSKSQCFRSWGEVFEVSVERADELLKAGKVIVLGESDHKQEVGAMPKPKGRGYTPKAVKR